MIWGFFAFDTCVREGPYTPGEAVPLLFKITNAANRSFNITGWLRYRVFFSIEQRFDIENSVFLLLEPVRVEAVVLDSGESVRFETSWLQVDNNGALVGPGTYFVQGLTWFCMEGFVCLFLIFLTPPLPLTILA